MVETRGYTLEEISIAFEGPDAYVAEVDRRLAAGSLMSSHTDVDSKDGGEVGK
jgi:hypothetical protein